MTIFLVAFSLLPFLLVELLVRLFPPGPHAGTPCD